MSYPIEILLELKKEVIEEKINNLANKIELALKSIEKSNTTLEEELKNRIFAENKNFVKIIEKAKNEMLPSFEVGRMELLKKFNELKKEKSQLDFSNNFKELYNTLKKQAGSAKIAKTLSENAKSLTDEALCRGIVITKSLCNMLEDTRSNLHDFNKPSQKETTKEQ